MEAQLVYRIYKLLTRFCTFGAKWYAQSVIINKISASELSQKFIKSALLVGLASVYHMEVSLLRISNLHCVS